MRSLRRGVDAFDVFSTRFNQDGAFWHSSKGARCDGLERVSGGPVLLKWLDGRRLSSVWQKVAVEKEAVFETVVCAALADSRISEPALENFFMTKMTLRQTRAKHQSRRLRLRKAFRDGGGRGVRLRIALAAQDKEGRRKKKKKKGCSALRVG